MWGADKMFPSGTTCATCLCQDRTLYAVKDSKSFSVYCYSLNVSLKDMVCWECNHFVLKMAIFRSKALKARAYRMGKQIWEPTKAKSLSHLSTSEGLHLDITPNQHYIDLESEPTLNAHVKAEVTDIEYEDNIAVKESVSKKNRNKCNKPSDLYPHLSSTYLDGYSNVYTHQNVRSNKQTHMHIGERNASPVLEKKKKRPNIDASRSSEVTTNGSDRLVTSTLRSLLTKKGPLKVPYLLEKVALEEPNKLTNSMDNALHVSETGNNPSSIESKIITNSISIPTQESLHTEVIIKNEEPLLDSVKEEITNDHPEVFIKVEESILDNVNEEITNVHPEVLIKAEEPILDSVKEEIPNMHPEVFIKTEQPILDSVKQEMTNDSEINDLVTNDFDDEASSSMKATVLNGFITLYPQRNDERTRNIDLKMDDTTRQASSNSEVNSNATPKKEAVATASLLTLLNKKNSTLNIPTSDSIVKEHSNDGATVPAETGDDELLIESQGVTDTLASTLERPGISTANLVAQARESCPWYVRVLSRSEIRGALAAARAAPAFAAAPYRCARCALVFAGDEDMHAHGLLHEPSSGPLSCDVCTRRFRSDAELRAHAARHATRYCCCQCDFSAERICDAQRHNCEPDAAMWEYKRRRRKKQRHVRCKVCYTAFSDEGALGRHVARMHPVSETPVCSICQKQFKNRHTLNAHYATVHKMKERPGRPELFCSECGLQFHNPSAFRKHRLTLKHCTKDEWQFQCDTCKRKFPSKGYLKSHIRVLHNKESKVTLTEHLRHEGRRPHACPHCAETFTYRAALYTHTRRRHGQTDTMESMEEH